MTNSNRTQNAERRTQNSNYLVIDTSSSGIQGMGLFGSGIPNIYTWTSAQAQLSTQFEKFLASAQISLEEIAGYIICIGPGSFTGLRVGLSFLKGLSYAYPKPIAGVISMDVLKECALVEIKKRDISIQQVVAVRDARRGHYYISRYDLGKGNCIRLCKPEFIECSELLAVFKKEYSKILVTDDTLDPEFSLGSRLIKIEMPQFLEGLYRAGAKMIVNNVIVDYKKLLPVYVYPHWCNVRRK